MSRRLPLLVAMVALAGMAMAAPFGCKPWTVRPLVETDNSGPRPETFDAGAYVAGIWSTQVLPKAKSSSTELRDALAGGAADGSPVFVRAHGTIVRVDRTSRVGLALLDLHPGDGVPDVAVQIGPVLRGTALRDALPFIRFGDFANQVQFADVANALNAQVTTTVLDDLDVGSLEGRALTCWGAATFEGRNVHRLPEIIPVLLEGTLP